jgi:hypothetical protein
MSNELKQARAELESAQRAIDAMRASESMDRFEAEWRHFLSCLEKVWVKVERSCEPKKNIFQPWQGKFERLRKKDMLLRYLKQARNADNHSIQELAEINPGGTSLSFINPYGGYIKHMRAENGKITHYEGDPAIIKTIHPHPVAVRVKNDGQWYNPPTSHLGKHIDTAHPLELAVLGLDFYKDFVDQVEKKFF